MEKAKKTIVISAVNLVSGGTLTILHKCVKALSEINSTNDFRVIVLVNNKSIFDCKNIEFIEFPKAKKNWFNRIKLEYFGFVKLSKDLKPYLWLSLHDITPNVVADRRVVYCHNPTPFMKLSLVDFKFDMKVVLFALFYKYLYRINIRKNDYVVVQQMWLKNEFANIFGVKKEKIVVAYPTGHTNEESEAKLSGKINNDITTFFYPSLSRQFKNFEIICQAVEILNKRKINNYKVVLSVDGTENAYSNWLLRKYGHLDNIVFQGLIPYEQMDNYYRSCDCLIFPSKLETWGLPISEFSVYDKPMILADLPYAHETANTAKMVDYFDCNSALQLSEKMNRVINKDYSLFRKHDDFLIEEPFVQNITELLRFLINDDAYSIK